MRSLAENSNVQTLNFSLENNITQNVKRVVETGMEVINEMMDRYTQNHHTDFSAK